MIGLCPWTVNVIEIFSKLSEKPGACRAATETGKRLGVVCMVFGDLIHRFTRSKRNASFKEKHATADFGKEGERGCRDARW